MTKRRPLLSISAANASFLLSGERGGGSPGEGEEGEEKADITAAADGGGRVQRRALLQAGAHQRLHQQRQQRRQRRASSRLRNQRLLVPPLVVSEDPLLHPPPLPPPLDPKSELRRRQRRRVTSAPEGSQSIISDLYAQSDAVSEEEEEEEAEEDAGEEEEVKKEAVSMGSGRGLSQQRPQKNWRVKPLTAQQRQQALIGALASSHQAQTAAIARQAALGTMHQRRSDRAELFAQLGGASRGLRGHVQERGGRRHFGEEEEEGDGGHGWKRGRVLVAAGEEGLDPEALRARLAQGGRRRDPGGTGAIQQGRRRDTGSTGVLRAAAATVAASLGSSSSRPGAADGDVAPRHPHFPRHPAAGRECLFLAGHSCEFSAVSEVDLEAGTLSLVGVTRSPCHSKPPLSSPV